jgi:hypothetical protein
LLSKYMEIVGIEAGKGIYFFSFSLQHPHNTQKGLTRKKIKTSVGF